MSSQEIVASNIARLRAEKELTQAELAERADLSRVTLGKIERADVLPRSATLSALARGLGVPVSALVTPVRELPGVRFRAAKRVNTREQILAEVATWLDNYDFLEDALGRSKDFALKSLLESDADPIALAGQARRLLGLNSEEPIHDVCGLLEDSGVRVLLIRKATDSFFGLSVSALGGGPAAVINTWERISVERWIFTAAHELGHLLMHQEAYDRTRDDEVDGEEKDADRFAAHFLLPRAGFEAEWQEASGHALLDRVLKIKRIFRVSYKTILNRLVEMGEPKTIWRDFQVQHKRKFKSTLKRQDETHPMNETESGFKWQRAGEPDALSTYDFVEDRLARLVRVALEREVISQGRAAEILGIPRAEMRVLQREWLN